VKSHEAICGGPREGGEKLKVHRETRRGGAEKRGGTPMSERPGHVGRNQERQGKGKRGRRGIHSYPIQAILNWKLYRIKGIVGGYWGGNPRVSGRLKPLDKQWIGSRASPSRVKTVPFLSDLGGLSDYLTEIPLGWGKEGVQRGNSLSSTMAEIMTKQRPEILLFSTDLTRYTQKRETKRIGQTSR